MGAPVVDINDAPGATLTAVLLHPHPDMGGDRFNHVVDALYQTLPKRGFSTARFDFSSSDLETATGEAAAVLDQLGRTRAALIGYSFGAAVALEVTGPRVLGWVLVAPYLLGAGAGAALDPRPKLLLVPEHDQWSPPGRAGPLTAGWASTTMATVAGADHFLAGRTAPVVDAALDWLRHLADGAA